MLLSLKDVFELLEPYLSRRKGRYPKLRINIILLFLRLLYSSIGVFAGEKLDAWWLVAGGWCICLDFGEAETSNYEYDWTNLEIGLTVIPKKLGIVCFIYSDIVDFYFVCKNKSILRAFYYNAVCFVVV